MKPILVSIAIPCFNHAEYIEASIRSVMEHDYDHIELVVVNDGSTDNSLDVITALQNEYSFKVINQENRGLTAAVNAGFKATNGKYFTSFDSDDIMLPGRLKLQVDYLETRPEVGGCGANFTQIDRLGNHIDGAPVKKAASYTFDDIFRLNKGLGAPTSLFKRQAIIDAGGYDINNKIQDLGIELQITHAGYRLDVLENIVTLYRRHDRNMSSDYKAIFPFYLMAANKYPDARGYIEVKRHLINSRLKTAVIEDKVLARELFRQLPLYHWNKKTLRRFWRYLRHKA